MKCGECDFQFDKPTATVERVGNYRGKRCWAEVERCPQCGSSDLEEEEDEI
jgi:hypothetical protein